MRIENDRDRTNKNSFKSTNAKRWLDQASHFWRSTTCPAEGPSIITTDRELCQWCFLLSFPTLSILSMSRCRAKDWSLEGSMEILLWINISSSSWLSDGQFWAPLEGSRRRRVCPAPGNIAVPKKASAASHDFGWKPVDRSLNGSLSCISYIYVYTSYTHK